MQILHCKIKERNKGKRKCTSGENTTLQNKKKETKGKENLHLVKILHCKMKERKKGKRKCTSGANCTLQNKRKEREKKMYIWCKLYIAK